MFVVVVVLIKFLVEQLAVKLVSLLHQAWDVLGDLASGVGAGAKVDELAGLVASWASFLISLLVGVVVEALIHGLADVLVAVVVVFQEGFGLGLQVLRVLLVACVPVRAGVAGQSSSDQV